MMYEEYKFNGQVNYRMPCYPTVVGLIQESASSSSGGPSVPGLDQHEYGGFFHCEVNERRRIYERWVQDRKFRFIKPHQQARAGMSRSALAPPAC